MTTFPNRAPRRERQGFAAQFIRVCSSVNLNGELRISDQFFTELVTEEQLSHGDCVASPPLLQCRHVSILHPYVALERSAPAVSPLSEPQRWPLGRVSCPARPETLPL